MKDRPFIPEAWMTSPDAPVYHVSHPDRDAWCGARFGPSAFIGIMGVTVRRCRRCQWLGEGA